MFGGFAAPAAADGKQQNATPTLSFGFGSRRSFLEEKARLTDSPAADLQGLRLGSSPVVGLKEASPASSDAPRKDQLQGTASRISKSLNISVEEALELCRCARARARDPPLPHTC